MKICLKISIAFVGLFFVSLGLSPVQSVSAAEKFIILQSTTSTQNSGLYDHILPLFTALSGIEVRVVAVGTGQAIRNAENCDGDVLLVHARDAEEAFVSRGYGVKRTDLMFNDFVIIGPDTDPARVGGMTSAAGAFRRIAGAGAAFASRGDNSGTHEAEQRLWRAAGIDAEAASGTWYRETGSGMGATLNIAAGIGAYALTDRATWTRFGNKANLEIQVEGDPGLFNQYGVILVNPDRCKSVKAKMGQTFIDWLLSGKGQSAIRSYRVDGEPLFFPNAPVS